eukprot:scaffold91761_cov97-Phaeocystis_antarctica.AAC.3
MNSGSNSPAPSKSTSGSGADRGGLDGRPSDGDADRLPAQVAADDFPQLLALVAHCGRAWRSRPRDGRIEARPRGVVRGFDGRRVGIDPESRPPGRWT